MKLHAAYFLSVPISHKWSKLTQDPRCENGAHNPLSVASIATAKLCVKPTWARSATGSMSSGAMNISWLQWRDGSCSGIDVVIQPGKSRLGARRRRKTMEAVGWQHQREDRTGLPRVTEGCWRQTGRDGGRWSRYYLWQPNPYDLQGQRTYR